MKYQSSKVLSFAILSALALPVAAQGIVLNNEDLRTDLNWLNQQGVIQISNLSSMKYFSFLASFGKLAYLDLSNKPL